MAKFFSKAVGAKLCNEVNEVAANLGQSYRHPRYKGEDVKLLPVGDSNAFITYIKHMRVKTSGEKEAATFCYI